MHVADNISRKYFAQEDVSLCVSRGAEPKVHLATMTAVHHGPLLLVEQIFNSPMRGDGARRLHQHRQHAAANVSADMTSCWSWHRHSWEQNGMALEHDIAQDGDSEGVRLGPAPVLEALLDVRRGRQGSECEA